RQVHRAPVSARAVFRREPERILVVRRDPDALDLRATERRFYRPGQERLAAEEPRIFAGESLGTAAHRDHCDDALRAVGFRGEGHLSLASRGIPHRMSRILKVSPRFT